MDLCFNKPILRGILMILLVFVVRQTSTSCDSTPCLNGGTCITDIYDFSKFSCYCASGFTGLSCEGIFDRFKT